MWKGTQLSRDLTGNLSSLSLDEGLRTRLYSLAAGVVALTYPVCISLLFLGVKEQPDPADLASGQGLGFLAGLGLTARHPPYVKLVVSFLFISAAVQVEQSYLVLFCTHAAQLRDHVQGLVLTILVSAVLSTPLWEWVLQRFGKRTSALGICVMVPFAVLLAGVPTAPVAYVVAFVSGVSIAVSLLLPWSMLPDVVDDFQLQHRHGPGLETIFYTSYVFFTKLSGACALGISALSLEFAGYKVGACRQAAEVVVTLKVLISAVPTCLVLVGLCILMVRPTPRLPGQDSAHQQSLRRWAPCAPGTHRQGHQPQGDTQRCPRQPADVLPLGTIRSWLFYSSPIHRLPTHTWWTEVYEVSLFDSVHLLPIFPVTSSTHVTKSSFLPVTLKTALTQTSFTLHTQRDHTHRTFSLLPHGTGLGPKLTHLPLVTLSE